MAPPDLVAAIDQMRAMMRDVASVLGDYRRALIDQGVEPDEALEMCIEVQRGMLFDDLDRDEGELA